MLVTPGLGEEIDRLLPKLQQQLAEESEAILKGIANTMPTDKEFRRIIKGEDINILLKHEIKIWRRYYG